MISQLGRYEIISELGQGSMGVVYKAKDPLIDRTVAIKTINLSLALGEKEEYEERFYQEAKSAGSLSHPNIVTIYDQGKSGDMAYIAMEFLQGRELRDILDEQPLLPVGKVLDIVTQVAQGLAYAHEHDVVHRDVKPSNIMVMRDGHVKITDFGIAQMKSAAVRTKTGMVLGSPKYMSPEQVVGKVVDQRSDIFSLGVLMYEMLVGRSPFDGENVNVVMDKVLNIVPPPPSSLNPAVPNMLDFIVAKALSKGLDDRYQCAEELVTDLSACRDSILRSGAPVDVSNAVPIALPDAISPNGQVEMDAGESRSVPTKGLSQAFDSSVATMRLAALTTVPEEVKELTNILRMARPSADAINQASSHEAVPPIAIVDRPVSARFRQSEAYPPSPSKRGNLLLIAVIVVVLLDLVIAFVF